MRYSFKMPPQDPKSIPQYLTKEMFEIAQAMSLPVDKISLDPQHRAPTKPRLGDVVCADGTDWKPDGVGGGFFGYFGGVWVKLG